MKILTFAFLSLLITFINCSEKADQGFAAFDQQNYSKAYHVWSELAKTNNAKAEYGLWRLLYYGLGVPKDTVTAMSWLKKSAEQEYLQAQFDLGTCYWEGIGVVADRAVALKWFQSAAAKGDPHSQLVLGICYLDGIGIDKNSESAINWLRKAAEKDEPEALYRLFGCYYLGRGVAKDSLIAIEYLKKVADYGDPDIHFMLGWMLLNANKNIEAYKWLYLAKMKGHNGALTFCCGVEQRLKKEELFAGEKLARKWKQKTLSDKSHLRITYTKR